MNSRIRWVVIGLVVLAASLLVVGAVRRVRAERQVTKVKDLRDQLTGEAGRKLSPEQRREAWQQFRQEAEKLSPQQREALWADQRKASREKLDRFFKLPARERMVELDREINRMEAARKQRRTSGGR